MNKAAAKPQNFPRYSVGWGLGVALFHFTVTFAIVGAHFVAGMGSFTEDTSSQITLWRAVQWVWTPLAMAAWDPQKSMNPGSLVGLAFLWSCIVGVVAGFVAPLVRRWLHQPLYPTANESSRNS